MRSLFCIILLLPAMVLPDSLKTSPEAVSDSLLEGTAGSAGWSSETVALLLIAAVVVLYIIFRITLRIVEIKSPLKSRDTGLYLGIAGTLLLLMLIYTVALGIVKLTGTEVALLTALLLLTGLILSYEPLRNLASGLILMTGKAFKPGDVICIGTHTAKVQRRTAFRVVLMESSGNLIHIPNSRFFTETFINKSADPVLFPVAFNMVAEIKTDSGTLRERLRETAGTFPYCSSSREPEIYFSPAGNGQIRITVHALLISDHYEGEFISYMTEMAGLHFQPGYI